MRRLKIIIKKEYYSEDKKDYEYVAYTPDYPCIIGVGKTKQEAKDELLGNVEAYKEYLITGKE